jgi:cytochrome b561
LSEAVSRYSRSSIAIHWVTAVGLTLAVALGWRMSNAGGSERASLLAWHISAGMGILLLTIARIATRVRSSRPPPIGARWEQRAASVTHMAFYVALIVIPLLGWLIVSASGAPNHVFGFLPLPSLPGVAGRSALGAFTENMHRLLAYGLCVVVVLHTAAAVKHHFADPSSGLMRILPGARRLWGWRMVCLTAVLTLTFTFASGLADAWLPNSLRLARAPEASRNLRIDPRSAHVFETVHPIFVDKCSNCHGSRSSKGGLRLDTFAAVSQGGEGGKAVTPGKTDESELIRRIMLSPSHKDVMPPAGKPPLTPAESQLLLWWVGSGADDSTTILAANPPPLIQSILTDLGVSSESPALAKKVARPASQVLDALRDTFRVQFLYSGNGLMQAEARFDQKGLRPLSLEPLAAIAAQLVLLDLSGAQISGRQIAELSKLRNLQRLNLARTATDDASLKGLGDLPYLEVLNLYETKVTDASFATIARLPALTTVYLAHTQVTAEGVERLRRDHSSINVVWATPNQPTIASGGPLTTAERPVHVGTAIR